MMQMDIGVIIGIAGVLFGILFGYLGWKRQFRKDSYQEGGQSSAMQADIQYIKRRSDDTYIEVKEIKKSQDELTQRVTRVEESAKSAHLRIDELCERIN